ncbi:hypothetical protein DCAR_0101205 [Daucus carota subsp. sativus]|uniref:FAR1 domain-containing protein n=1 Tax=Daucus carota subsp. sativus TaxID=79200 RepID=A0AAF0W4M8_DAUCS|nr:hypothetical protein DCAR_0101205 [Daucus carota subsp. sativus]
MGQREYSLTPGGSRVYVPKDVDLEHIPSLNQIFESLDIGYKFYKNYGRLGGFDIRKTTEKRDDDGTVIRKHYVCSSEGFNDVDIGSLESNNWKNGKERRTASRRCGCKAKMVLKYTSGNRYYVFSFVEQHNHPLASKTGRQFLRVSRDMGISSRNFVFAAGKANIG